MKPAIIVVDMLKDNLKESPRNPYFEEGRAVIPKLQRLLEEGRKKKFPVIFACDSFLENDFIKKLISSEYLPSKIMLQFGNSLIIFFIILIISIFNEK